MRRGRRQKYQAGHLLPWTRRPYGYRVDPSRPRDPAGVRLEPTEVAVVADLFASYLQEGQSLKRVTTHLIELQIPTRSRTCTLESSYRAWDFNQSSLHWHRL